MVSYPSVIYVAFNHIYVYQHLKNVELLGMHGQYNDLLCAGQSGDRIPVGVRFSTPVNTRPGSRVAGVWRRPPPPLSSLWAFMICYRVNFKL